MSEEEDVLEDGFESSKVKITPGWCSKSTMYTYMYMYN